MTGADVRPLPETLYAQAIEEFGLALARLARGYETDSDRCRDLLQEIHIALWRSFALFDGRCALRTWVYRIAHNTATSRVLRGRLRSSTLISLTDLAASLPAVGGIDPDRDIALQRVYTLIHALRPLDRQVMMLYLEGCDAGGIADVTGLSTVNVATKVHRIKQLLTKQFHEGNGR